jgi:hypothetical protein
MPYRIAGIDVHKQMLAVVVADVEIDGDFHFDRQKVGTTPADLRGLADWLVVQDVEEVVMESTAQYWRPGWEALEQHWRPRRRARDGAPRLAGTLHLAQAQSNRGPGGRKRDFPDAERLVKRLVAQELTGCADSRRCKVNGRWCARRTTCLSSIASACKRRGDSFFTLDRQVTHAAIAESGDRYGGRAARANVTVTAITRTDS